jgi:hypothetical protein
MLEKVLDFAFVAVRLLFRARFDQRMRIIHLAEEFSHPE